MLVKPRWAMAAVALALLLTGCSGSADPAAESAPSSASVAELAPSSTPVTATSTRAPMTPAPTTTAPLAPCLADPGGCTLREVADARGLYIGAAMQPSRVDNVAAYGETLAREFNSLTPESAFKWPRVQPEADVFDWAQADAVVEFARANDMAIRGHTLIFANSPFGDRVELIPDYVIDETDPETMRLYLREHIEAVVGRYGDVVDRWDVVNEAFMFRVEILKQNQFTTTMGEQWIADAFRIADELAPDAKLYFSETKIETPGLKHTAVVDFVRGLIESGVPIDGVALHGHFTRGVPPQAELEASMRAFTELGLEVAITELDIPAEGNFESQAEQYATVVAACLAVEGCVEITVWGVSDANTWLDAVIGPGSEPLLFDADYEPKPAYVAFKEQLAAGP